MIGILYSRSMLDQLIDGRQCFEKPAFYLHAARHTGEEIIFFSLLDINWIDKTVDCWNGEHYVRLNRDIPSVIINRTRANNPYSRKMIKKLKEMGIIIINEHNVVSKLEINRILSQNKALLPYLPETNAVSNQSVTRLLEKYDRVFLKPSTASVGKGIIRLRKKTTGTIAEFNVLGRTKREKVTIEQIVNMIKREKREYIVQQGIPLMKYEGKIVDFRVSVQKDGDGEWQCTGIVGRMATKGAVVTNLHCGGKPIKISSILPSWGWDVLEVENKIANLGIRIAKELEKELPHIADIGLDIALDEQKHPWLIEVNFRDLRITFRDAGEKEKWKATFENPINYAVHLIYQMKEKKESLQKEKEYTNSLT